MSFSPIVGKYESEKLQIQTFFTHFKSELSVVNLAVKIW